MVTSKICRFYSSMDNLKLAVLESLSDIDRDSSLFGWIHGSEVVDPKATLDEMTRLRGDNDELRRKLADLEAAKSFLDAESSKSPTDILSEDAKELLLVAANADGCILYLRTLGGAMIQSGQTNFVKPPTAREEARWKGAIDELRSMGLVESLGGKGEVFDLTKRGYDVADQISTPLPAT